MTVKQHITESKIDWTEPRYLFIAESKDGDRDLFCPGSFYSGDERARLLDEYPDLMEWTVINPSMTEEDLAKWRAEKNNP